MTCQFYDSRFEPKPYARLFCGKIVVDIKPSFGSKPLTPQRARNALKRMGFIPGPWKSADWGVWCRVARGTNK